MNFFKRYESLLFALCLLGIVFGSKLWILEEYGSDLPSRDQWDAEASDLLLPYQKGELTFPKLLTPHNEHRIFFTKAVDLLLFEIGGQWDARPQCVVSAAIHSFFAAFVFLLIAKILAPRWRAALFIACAILFGLPMSWHNVINGFQSQFYFLLLFSLGCIGLVLYQPKWSAGWWLGMILGVLANFTMGSGLLAAAAVASVALLRALLRHTTWREVWPLLAGCGCAIAVGLATRVSVPWHEGLRARSVEEFSLTLVHLLQWPMQDSSWWSLVIYGPLLLLLTKAVTVPRTEHSRSENILLTLGAWVLLQCLATSYARGMGAPWPSPRYCDTLAFGLLINAVILAYLLDRGSKETRWVKMSGWVVLALWMIIVVPSVGHHLVTVLGEELPNERNFIKDCERNVSLYLSTGDSHYIEAETRPHPNAQVLKERLSHPEIRTLLPTSVRTSVPVVAQGSATTAFVEKRIENMPPSFRGDLVRWNSRSEDGASGLGTWQSEPFTPAFSGYLRVELSGQPRTQGTTLHIRDVASGKILANVIPARQPNNVWRVAYVRVPNRPIQLIANDTSGTNFLAFSQPVEMSVFSFLTLRFVKQGWLILIISITAAVLLKALLFVCRQLEINDEGSAEAASGSAQSFFKKFRRLLPFPLPPQIAASHAFGPWLLTAGAVLALAKLWLVSAQTVLAVGGAGHDDQLFVDLADTIYHGHWLGSYSQFTLMKGPMYSIFIACTNWFGVPLFTAQQLLYIAACMLVVRSLRPLCPNKGVRFALYAVLLFNPVTYDSLVHGRVLRQDILPGLVLIIVAGFVAMYSRPRDSKLRLAAWSLSTGVALGAFWLTREEGVWLVPFITLLSTAAGVAIWRGKQGDRVQRFGLLSFPFAIWATMVFVVASTNLIYYGVFTTCEFKHKDFKDAFGALLRVDPAEHRPYLSVSREKRERLYKLSPAFAELQPYLEGSLGEAWARTAECLTHRPPEEREIAVGWFMWALRDAVAEAGHCTTGADAMAFYRKMASEINSSVHRGKIKGGPRRSGFLSPLRPEHVRPFFDVARHEFKFFIALEQMYTTQFHSMGPPEYVQLFRDMTRSRVAPLPEEAPLPQTYLREDQVRLAVLDKIGRGYKALMPFLSWLAIATSLSAIILAVVRRRWCYFLLLAVGCVGSVLALVVINSLIEVTSFPAVNTGYFTGGYGLWLLFLFASGIALFPLLKPSAPPQPPASPKEN